MIILETSLGNIKITLDSQHTPKTAENFLQYVQDGFYDGLIFHRVIPGFMVQGGGMSPDMQEKPSRPSIANEADLGGSNLRGSLAMARTPDPDSASSQFFINLVDNKFLDFKDKTPNGWGYCVFGKVVEGMDIVDKIAQQPTGSRQGHQDVPVEPITINKAYETTEGGDDS